jgi:hypothetical protein
MYSVSYLALAGSSSSPWSIALWPIKLDPRSSPDRRGCPGAPRLGFQDFRSQSSVSELSVVAVVLFEFAFRGGVVPNQLSQPSEAIFVINRGLRDSNHIVGFSGQEMLFQVDAQLRFALGWTAWRVYMVRKQVPNFTG